MSTKKAKDLERKKSELIGILTKELPVFRTKLRVTQDNLAKTIGISRQTITNAESSYKTSWHIFLLLFLYFDSQEITKQYLQTMGDFTDRVYELIKTEKARGLLIMKKSNDTEQK